MYVVCTYMIFAIAFMVVSIFTFCVACLLVQVRVISCQRMAEKGCKVVFVRPTERLLQEFEGEAVMINNVLAYHSAMLS